MPWLLMNGRCRVNLKEWYVWKDRYQEKALEFSKDLFNESGLSCY